MSFALFWLYQDQNPKEIQELINTQFIKKGIRISKMNCYADIPKLKLSQREELLNFGFVLMDSPHPNYMERAALIDITSFVSDTTETTIILITEDVTFPVFLNRLKSTRKFRLFVVSSSPFSETPSHFIDKVIHLKSSDDDSKKKLEEMENELVGLLESESKKEVPKISGTIHLEDSDEIIIDGNNLEQSNPSLRNICKYNAEMGSQILHSLLSKLQTKFDKPKKIKVVYDRSDSDQKMLNLNGIEFINSKINGKSADEVFSTLALQMTKDNKFGAIFITSDFELTQRLTFYEARVYKSSDFFNLIVYLVNGIIPENMDTFMRSFVNRSVHPLVTVEEKDDFEKSTLDKIKSLCKDEWNNIGYVNENLSINSQKIIKTSYGRMSTFLREHQMEFTLRGDYVHFHGWKDKDKNLNSPRKSSPRKVSPSVSPRVGDKNDKWEKLDVKGDPKFDPKDSTHSKTPPQREKNDSKLTIKDIFGKIYAISGNEWTNRGYVFENLPIDFQRWIKKEYVTMTGFFKSFPENFQLDYDYVKLLKL